MDGGPDAMAGRKYLRNPEAGKHGQDTLEYVLLSLIPELQKRYGPLPIILGGYSLGGLFALWASAQSDSFKAGTVRDMSPFMVYPIQTGT